MPTFNSTAIRRAEYNPETRRMKLWFADGGEYDFCRVPQNVFDGLCNASSKGRYYHAFIRDRYDC